MDLLKLVQKIPNCPPIFRDDLFHKFGEKATIPNTVFPTPTFASAPPGQNGRAMPHIIAHRGHKAKYPENTLKAFEAAIDAGAHAIETDVHLSKDGIVVLSHDDDLKRCFGVDRKVKDCDWNFLKTLRTTQAPNEPLACLQDLLELFRRSEWKSTWLLLDIKTDDDPEELMDCLAKTFKAVDLGPNCQWKDKLLLGYWTARFVPLCHKYFPGFSIANIGFSVTYCSQFLAVPNVAFNTLQASLVSPFGRYFIRKVKARQRQIFSWTVNTEKGMDWCIRREIDGVVTDDVTKAVEMYEKYDQNTKYRWSWTTLLQYLNFNFWLFLFGFVFLRKYGSCI